MNITLIRIYGRRATNGYLIAEGQLICKTIERPWRSNQPFVSCIPEGKYYLKERHSPRFGRCLEVADVPGRTHILFHPANNAELELSGCIAPVLELVGQGMGLCSRQAMQRLLDRVLPVMEKGEQIILNITE